jgi:hypothetical protein
MRRIRNISFAVIQYEVDPLLQKPAAETLICLTTGDNNIEQRGGTEEGEVSLQSPRQAMSNADGALVIH